MCIIVRMLLICHPSPFLCLLLKAYAVCCTSPASADSEDSHDSAQQEALGDLSASDLSKLESAFEQLVYLVEDLDHAKGTCVWDALSLEMYMYVCILNLRRSLRALGRRYLWITSVWFSCYVKECMCKDLHFWDAFRGKSWVI